jgi:hypothetical protein
MTWCFNHLKNCGYHVGITGKKLKCGFQWLDVHINFPGHRKILQQPLRREQRTERGKHSLYIPSRSASTRSVLNIFLYSRSMVATELPNPQGNNTLCPDLLSTNKYQDIITNGIKKGFITYIYIHGWVCICLSLSQL